MKKLCLLIVITFLLFGTMVFADRSVLVDFTKLAADVKLGNQDKPSENTATLVDFSGVAGSSFAPEDRAKMKTSLAIDNWEVQLASSSRTVFNQSFSMTRTAVTKPTAKDFEGEKMANVPVMGVRIHFPSASYNAYAIIKPPFEIPAYAIKTELKGDRLEEVAGDPGTKFDTYGVVRNVGVLKSVEVTVYGSNFPNGFGIILKDQDGMEQNIFMDYLRFDGWRRLIWKNPNYVEEVRNREIRQYPLYPKSEPFRKLEGLVIYRDAIQEGGDIVTYVKDIVLTYDKAVLDTQREIEDEAVWGILKARQEARQAAEIRRLGNLQVLRFQEKQKMHQVEEGAKQ